MSCILIFGYLKQHKHGSLLGDPTVHKGHLGAFDSYRFLLRLSSLAHPSRPRTSLWKLSLAPHCPVHGVLSGPLVPPVPQPAIWAFVLAGCTAPCMQKGCHRPPRPSFLLEFPRVSSLVGVLQPTCGGMAPAWQPVRVNACEKISSGERRMQAGVMS